MSFNNLLASVINKIKNGQRNGSLKVVIKHYNSTYIKNFLSVLVREGYIYDFMVLDTTNSMVLLKYYKNSNTPLLKYISLISKPGKRVYMGISELRRLVYKKNKYHVYILSTTSGVLSSNEALKLNLGGEVLCQIF